MVDEQKLRQLAEEVSGWVLNQVQQQPDDLEAGVACVGGRNDDDSFAEVMTIDTGLYFAEEKAIGLANFYAAANPAAILSLLDELQTLREERAAWRVTAENAEKDAARYRWLRAQNWEENRLGVVVRPKDNTKLGCFLPSDTRLDDTIDHMSTIDAAMKEES